VTGTTSPRICLAGKNQIAVDALLHMIERGWKERLLVCPNRTDDGISCWQPSLLHFARELGIEVVTLDTLQEMDNLIFLSLEFDQIVRPAAFKSDRLYNIHFSALPAYKGMYTSALPILHGAQLSGVTLHEIDPGIDTGPIIDQAIFGLPETWTARDLYFKYIEQGLDLFCRQLDSLVAERPPLAHEQSTVGSTYFSKLAINYGKVTINLHDTANGVARQLRAFSFREYQMPNVEGLEIGAWRILPERSLKKPGTLLERGEDRVTIATIDYDIQLERFRDWDWFRLNSHESTEGFDPSHINFTDKMGWTPLIRATYAGNVALLQRLLRSGADPNKPNTNGTTPLMYACSGQEPDRVMKVLLEYGADPKKLDRFERDLKKYLPERTARLVQ
jgi:methionyl-tRNA formyltransferase